MGNIHEEHKKKVDGSAQAAQAPSPDPIPRNAAFGLRDKLVQTGLALSRIEPEPSAAAAVLAEPEKKPFWRYFSSLFVGGVAVGGAIVIGTAAAPVLIGAGAAGLIVGWLVGPKSSPSAASSSAKEPKRSAEEVASIIAKLGTSDKSLQAYLLPLREAQERLNHIFDDVNHLLRSRVLALHRSIGAIIENVKEDPDDVSDAPELTVYVTHATKNVEQWIQLRVHVKDRDEQKKHETEILALLEQTIDYLGQTLKAMRSGDQKMLSTQMKVLREVIKSQLEAENINNIK